MHRVRNADEGNECEPDPMAVPKMRVDVAAQALLAQAQAEGVRVQTHGGMLRITGPPHAALLIDQLLSHRSMRIGDSS
jgi:hypothetical protein